MLDATDRPASVLSPSRDNGFFFFDSGECEARGRLHHAEYVGAEPFPHIVLDGFLPPGVLHRVIQDFPARERGRFANAHSRLKTGYKLGQIRSSYIQDLLSALNSASFLRFLEGLTGIDGLISDAHFAGGGLHETARGGHLSVHVDFNIHPHTRLLRRLNLILFLNPAWESDWGGELEFWDRGMKACRKSVAPIMGRAVIFNTDSTSYHGHPEPLACPEHVFRRSLALYYYTAPEAGRGVRHTTLFRPRPGAGDQPLSIREKLLDRGYRLIARRSAPRPPTL